MKWSSAGDLLATAAESDDGRVIEFATEKVLLNGGIPGDGFNSPIITV